MTPYCGWASCSEKGYSQRFEGPAARHSPGDPRRPRRGSTRASAATETLRATASGPLDHVARGTDCCRA
eukprot:scaffold137_cov398-Prasinococcus_capsulatus_cf.AAC.15